MGKKTIINMSKPLSDDEMRQHRQSQGDERAKRGMVSFTRKTVREAVMGGTQGEADLATGARAGQVTYPKKKSKPGAR